MADIIQLLPDTVANQIAAGEVIQRPSSVVKELMENALDAGAQQVDVIIADAGRTTIQVIDDGKGMSETDARLAFERHATSKIRKAEDLFSLTTMGFRGEALPSIAAVAQVTLRTRMADSDLGTLLNIEGGHVINQEPDACPVGANFLVQNLFYNVPARRKFLKTNQTELSQITQEFERVALSNPDVRFSLTHDDRTLVSLTAEGLRQRIATLFGKRLGDQLLSVDVETTLCQLHGFVGLPETSRRKGVRQFFYVNGRYMRHPYFHRAVQEAYSNLIPDGDQVPYFLFLEVEPSTIDVNIHPTKTEIKFENEQAIWQILQAAVREALGRFAAVPSIEFDTEGMPVDIPTYNPHTASISAVHIPQTRPLRDDYNPFANTGSSHKKVPSDWEKMYEEVGGAEKSNGTEASVNSTPSEQNPSNGILDLKGTDRSVQHYQYRGQYIVTEVRSGLMFIDQHLAHARVLYNRYRKQLAEHQAPSQGLLFPELLQLPPSDVPLVESIMDDLTSLGFDISSLGGGNYSIQGAPAGFDGVEPRQLLVDIIDDLRQKGQDLEEGMHHRMAMTMARNSAIPIGNVLTEQEMESLVDELFQQEQPSYAPDGRRIIAICPHEMLEKLFK